VVFIFGLFKSCFKNSLTKKHGKLWLAIIAALAFTFIRVLHIPILLMNLPLPFKFPSWFIKLSIYFVTTIFIVLLLSPVFTMIYTKIVTERNRLKKKKLFQTATVQRERPIINSITAQDIINNNFGSNVSLSNLEHNPNHSNTNLNLNLYKAASTNHMTNPNNIDDNSSIVRFGKIPSITTNNEEYSSTSRLNAQNNEVHQSSTKIDINMSGSAINLIQEPIVCIIMPIYNELHNILLEAIDRICDSNYDKSKLHLYLSFDDDSESYLYLKLMNSLGAQKYRIPGEAEQTSTTNENVDSKNIRSNSFNAQGGYPLIFNMVYREVKCTVIRNKHEGKRMTQANTFNAIKNTYENFVLTSPSNPALTLLFIDSDVLIDTNAIREFVQCFRDGKMAVTGLITCATSSNNTNFWWLLQDLEYVQGQMMDRCLENFLGGVTCLPGALTMVEYNTLKEVEEEYFKSRNFTNSISIIDYARFHLGEDRYLTHLFMDSLPYPNAVGFCSTAICKTEAPKRLSVLLKQRRRWLLGTFANEIYMFTDPILWKSRPLLLLLRFIHNCTRSISLLLYIFIISLIVGIFSEDNMIIETPIILVAIVIPLITNWIYMIYFGVTLHRYKTLLYPIMYIVHPFFSWLFFVYTIFTFNKRTWGGPRTISHTSMTNASEKTSKTNSVASSMKDRTSGLSKFSNESDDDQFENEIFNMYSEEYNKTIYLSEVDKNILYNAYGGRKREKDIETIVKRINSTNNRNSRNRLSEMFKSDKSNNNYSPRSNISNNIIASPMSANSQADTIVPTTMNRNTNMSSVPVSPSKYDGTSINGTIIANSNNIVHINHQQYYNIYYGKGKEKYNSDYSDPTLSSNFSSPNTESNKHESDNQTIYNH
jgi:cellulose synthase/poly-beta-1,6-N-acetylglucosamine synthase-like glycosyltransferase